MRPCFILSILWFLPLFLLPAPSAPSVPAPAPSMEFPLNPVLEALYASCVTVKTSDGGSGTGFVLVRDKDSYVLTAAHVLASERKVTPGNLSLTPPTLESVSFTDTTLLQYHTQDGSVVSESSHAAELLLYSEVEDLVLLRVKERGAFTKGVTLYSGSQVPPLGTLLFHAGSVSGTQGQQSLIPGFYSGHGRNRGSYPFDQIACMSGPGASGGMVCLTDGRVVGMVVSGKVGQYTLMIPIRRIHTWAVRNHLEWLFDEKLPVVLPKQGVCELP